MLLGWLRLLDFGKCKNSFEQICRIFILESSNAVWPSVYLFTLFENKAIIKLILIPGAPEPSISGLEKTAPLVSYNFSLDQSRKV